MNDRDRNRRYGRRHRNVRVQVEEQVNAGGVNCCRCGRPIQPGADFHLDHNDDGPGYKGAAHPDCNISANEGGWRSRKGQQVARSMDQLYCGRVHAPVGTISSNGNMIKHDGGGWRPVWVHEMSGTQADPPKSDIF